MPRDGTRRKRKRAWCRLYPFSAPALGLELVPEPEPELGLERVLVPVPVLVLEGEHGGVRELVSSAAARGEVGLSHPPIPVSAQQGDSQHQGRRAHHCCPVAIPMRTRSRRWEAD